MTADAAPQVDAEHPWPGLASFTEAGQAFFHGRDAEAAELMRLVHRAPLTVLFGQSGLGKSSLLQAGLFPLLRQQDFMPVAIRLDLSEHAQPLVSQVRQRIRECCLEQNAEFSSDERATSLWEYLHARDADIWGPRNRLLTPVLVIDQFEEIFTLGQRSPQAAKRCADFLAELADLVEQRVPYALEQRIATEPTLVEAFTVHRPVKVVFGFREDHLPDFEGLRALMPSVMHNRMRLTRMSGTQALSAVVSAGRQLVSEAVAGRIIRFVARAHGAGTRGDEVEPALLSVVCRELNNRRIADGQPQLTTELLDSGAPEQIISEFYERSFAGLAPAVRDWVEDHLLTSGGFRNSEAVEDSERRPGLSRAAIDDLVARRLLRLEDRFGVLRVELTHDVLTSVARTSRDRRALAQAASAASLREAARRRRQRVLLGSGLTALGAVAGLALVFFVLLQNTREEQRKLLRTQGQMLLAQAIVGLERGIPGDPGAYLSQALLSAPDQPATVARAVTLLSDQRMHPRLLHQSAAASWLEGATAMRWAADGRLELFKADAAVRLDTTSWKREALGFVGTRDEHEDWHGLRIGFGLGDPGPSVAAPSARRIVAYDAARGFAVWQGKAWVSVHNLGNGIGDGFSLAYSVRGDAGVVVAPDMDWVAAVDSEAVVVVTGLGGDAPRTIKPNSGERWRPVAIARGATHILLEGEGGRWHLAAWQGGAYRLASLGRLTLPPVMAEDGRTLIAVRDNDLIRADVDAQGAAPWRVLMRHTLPVLAFDTTRDLQWAVTGALDREARVIDTRKAALVGTPMSHHGAVTVVRFAGPDLVVTGARDGAVRLWQPGAAQPLLEPAIHAAAVADVAYDAGSSRLAVLGADGQMSLWQLSLRPAGKPLPDTVGVTALAVASDGRVLAVSQADGSLSLWSFDDAPRELWRVRDATPGSALAFRPDGGALALGGQNGSVEVYDVSDGRKGAVMAAGRTAIRRLAWSPEGKALASAAGLEVRQWAMPDGRPIRLPMVHTGPVEALRFSPDGRLLASATAPRDMKSTWQVQLWEADTSVELPPPQSLAAGERVGHLAWREGEERPLVVGGTWEGIKPWSGAESSDGRLLFGGGADGLAVLVEASNGRRIGVPMRHDNAVLGASFSPDGRWLVSRAADRRIRIWDTASGLPVADPVVSNAELPAVLVGGDRWLAMVDTDGALRLLDLGLDFRLPQPPWLARLVQAATGAELDLREAVVPLPDRLQRLAALQSELTAQPPDPWQEWGLGVLGRLFGLS